MFWRVHNFLTFELLSATFVPVRMTDNRQRAMHDEPIMQVASGLENYSEFLFISLQKQYICIVATVIFQNITAPLIELPPAIF